VSDLAQEVFLRLLRVQDTDTIRSPEAYLFTVANHVLYQHALKQSETPPTVDIAETFADIELVSDEDPTVRADTQQRIEELMNVLAQLSPKVRAALLLHRFAGYSIDEIAKQMGVARITAKRYLAAGLAHCRNARLDRE
jgi:RNA polymerase sigma-70 factor (ECF subfamily)